MEASSSTNVPPHTGSSGESAAVTASTVDNVLLHMWVIPEWRAYYIPYTVLKNEIKLLASSVPEVLCVSRHPLARTKAKVPEWRADGEVGLIGVGSSVVAAVNASSSGYDAGGGANAVDLNGSMVAARTTIFERFGSMTAADFAGSWMGDPSQTADMGTFVRTDSFLPAGADTGRGEVAAADRRKERPLPIKVYVRCQLLDTLEIVVSYMEYRVGRRLIQESSCGVSMDGVESFPTFEHLQLSERGGYAPADDGQSTGEPISPSLVQRCSAKEMEAYRYAFLVFRTLHEVNALAMARLRQYVGMVVEFYLRKSSEVAAAMFALVELSKRSDTLSERERDKVERFSRRAHFTLQMLQEYCDHNHLIVTQAIEKLMQVTNQDHEETSAVDRITFYSPPKYGQIALLESMFVSQFAKYFCEGEEAVATQRLKLEQVQTRKEALHKPMMLLQVGLLAGVIVGFGVASIVLYVLCVDVVPLNYRDSDSFMFSVSGILVLLAVLFALNVVVWEYFEINFVYSLHLDPVRHFTGLSLLRGHLLYGAAWTVVLFCFMHAATEESFAIVQNDAVTGTLSAAQASLSDATCAAEVAADASATRDSVLLYLPRMTLNSWVWAYAVFPVLAAVALFQYVASWGSTDYWLLRTLGRICVTPWCSVEFPDFFVCEQLVSIASTLYEIEFVWCYFHSDNVERACKSAQGNEYFVLLLLPSFWRVLQSLRRYRDAPFHRTFYPHLLNAVKYSVNCFAYTMYSLMHVAHYHHWEKPATYAVRNLFFIFAAIDAVFKCWYELWIEFGVLRRSAKTFFLRDRTLMPAWTYYIGIVINVVVRCLWVLKYFVEETWSPNSHWSYPTFAAAEVLRRAVWNIFRVENDQVSNTESYKVTTFAPSMHHDHPQKALWDVSVEDMKRSLTCAVPALEFWGMNDRFFRALSRSQRMVFLTGVVEALRDRPQSPTYPPQRAPAASTSAAAEAVEMTQSQQPQPPFGVNTDEFSGAYAARPPRRVDSRAEFLVDPRSGLKKTALMYFSEMYAEDKLRGFLLHMNGRSIATYLNDLVNSGDLDPSFVDDWRATAAPVRKASSVHVKQHVESSPTTATTTTPAAASSISAGSGASGTTTGGGVGGAAGNGEGDGEGSPYPPQPVVSRSLSQHRLSSAAHQSGMKIMDPPK